METMAKKRPRARRSFTRQFKADIVAACRHGDRSVGQVAKDFDLTETAVREWLKQAERDAGTRDGGLTSSEKEELAAQRRELVDPGTHLEAGSGASVLQRHSSGYTGGRR